MPSASERASRTDSASIARRSAEAGGAGACVSRRRPFGVSEMTAMRRSSAERESASASCCRRNSCAFVTPVLRSTYAASYSTWALPKNSLMGPQQAEGPRVAGLVVGRFGSRNFLGPVAHRRQRHFSIHASTHRRLKNKHEKSGTTTSVLVPYQGDQRAGREWSDTSTPAPGSGHSR